MKWHKPPWRRLCFQVTLMAPWSLLKRFWWSCCSPVTCSGFLYVCVRLRACARGWGGGLERRYQSIIDGLKWNKVQLDEIWPESPSTPPGCETLALGATDPDLMMTQHFTDVWISLRVKERQRQWHSVKCKTLSAFLSLSRLFEPPVVLWSGYRV